MHFGSKIWVLCFFGHYNQFGLVASQNIKEKSCYDDNVIVVKSRDGKTLGHVDHLTAKALVQIMNVSESLQVYMASQMAILVSTLDEEA